MKEVDKLGVFSMSPQKGKIFSNSNVIIKVVFKALEPKIYKCKIPVFLGKEYSKPYTDL